MFKEKVNARTDARRTTDYDISSMATASGAKNVLTLSQTSPGFYVSAVKVF